MTASDLAYQLGRVRDNLGIIEGFARAMHESILRELADGHFSDDFLERFENALTEVRDAVDECYNAVDDLPRGDSKHPDDDEDGIGRG